jgi:hypothetical protein
VGNNPTERQKMTASRKQFFKVAGLMSEMCENPSIVGAQEYIEKVLAVVDEVEEVNTIADYLNTAYMQYTIDSQRKEQHHGV